MRYAPFDWYATPAYYDIVFDPLAREEADFVHAVFQRHGRRRRTTLRALEPACGSGRVLEGLQRHGWSISGFDIEPAMIERARVRLPDATLRCQSMQAFTARKGFDVVFNLVSTFKYLPTDADALKHVARVADVLRPGGLFLLGLHLSDYSADGRTRERWEGRRDGTHVVCNTQRWPSDARTRTEKARARLVVTARGQRQGFESCWTFRTYDEWELMTLLEQEARLSHIATYGFDFDADAPVEDERRLDRVLVLQRRD